MKKHIFLTVAFIALALNAYSQTLTLVDDGKDTTTKIIFSPMIEGLNAKIYHVNSISSSVGSSYSVGNSYTSTGGFVGSTRNSTIHSSYGTNVTFLCETPAEFILDKGQLQLQVESGGITEPFTISATGGTQEWSVRPFRGGYFATGMIGMCGGLVAAALGFALGSSTGPSSLMAVGAAGAAAAVGGTILWVKSVPKIKLVRTTP